MLLVGCDESGKVQDEAKQAGRAPESFPAAGEDYFKAMDNGASLTPDEVKGRNMRIVWTGGNDRFWDVMTNALFGAFDLLKTLSSYPGLRFSRDNRWEYLGLVNEPCFTKPTGPDPHYGLRLDQRDPNCPLDPFANATKYPGVVIGARGKNVPASSYHGEPTGIVGLRLFPNPAFYENAKKNWDPDKFYTDPSCYQSNKLVRPYRVGMSCGFCHVGPSPSFEARVRSFQIGMEQMLWPEKREKDAVFGDKLPGVIDRTTATSRLSVPVGYLPEAFATFRTPLNRLLPGIFTPEGSVKLGPIPKGTPVDLIGNLDVLSDSTDPGERVAHAAKVAALLAQLKYHLDVLGPKATDNEARKVFAPFGRRLFELSKCPDYVVNCGHYFGADKFSEKPGLSDDDKRALIEFLKTF